MKKFWAAAVLAVVFMGCSDSDSGKDKNKSCEELGQVTCNNACYDKCANDAVRDPANNCECKAATTNTCSNVSCGSGASPDANNNCSCKCSDANKEYVGNACVPKCSADMTRDGSGVCQCTDSANKVKCGDACYDKCTDGSARDPNNNCECGADPCASTNCGSDADPDINNSCACKCKDGDKEYVGNACVPKCGAEMTRDGSGVCQCTDSANKVKCGDACYDKCSEGVRDPANNCECGADPCASANCGSDADPDINNSCACKCKDGNKEYVGNACVAKCPNNSTRDSNGVCQCDDTDKEIVGNACVAKCPGGATRDGSGVCQCDDADREIVGNACKCKDAKYDCDGNCIDQPTKACDPNKRDYTCLALNDNEKYWVDSTQAPSCDSTTCEFGKGACVEDTTNHCAREDKQCDYNSENAANNIKSCAVAKDDPNWDGDAKCLDTCLWDLSECSLCGNNFDDDEGEVCDFGLGNSKSPKTKDCKAYDPKYKTGSEVTCAAGCGSINDTTACELEPVCGNEKKEDDEACDFGSGNNSGPKTMDCEAYDEKYQSGKNVTCAKKCASVDTSQCEEKPKGILTCYFDPASITLSDTKTSDTVSVNYTVSSDVDTDSIVPQIGVISVDASGADYNWANVAEGDIACADGSCLGEGSVNKADLKENALSNNYIARLKYDGKNYYCLAESYGKKPVVVLQETELSQYRRYFGGITVQGGGDVPVGASLAEWHFTVAGTEQKSCDLYKSSPYCVEKDAATTSDGYDAVTCAATSVALLGLKTTSDESCTYQNNGNKTLRIDGFTQTRSNAVSTGKGLLIVNIPVSGASKIKLDMKVQRSNASSAPSHIIVGYSTDGVNYTLSTESKDIALANTKTLDPIDSYTLNVSGTPSKLYLKLIPYGNTVSSASLQFDDIVITKAQ